MMNQIIIIVFVCSGLALLIWTIFTLISVRKQHYEDFINIRDQKMILENMHHIENKIELKKSKLTKSEYENLLKLIQDELDRINNKADKS